MVREIESGIGWEQGCQIFFDTAYQNGCNVPKRGKILRMTIYYAKWPENSPNGHKIYQHLPLPDPPKFTQIGIFG
jgi:hypothetical protein